MDYLSYVQETIDMEGRGQLQEPKIEGLLEEICISFLASYKDRPKALASSTACIGSKKSVAIEICNLLRRAVKQDALLCCDWLCKHAQARVSCARKSLHMSFPSHCVGLYCMFLELKNLRCETLQTSCRAEFCA